MNEFDEIAIIDDLIQPLAGENPCGVDLRNDASPTSPYYTLKDIRNSARRKEREYVSDDADEISGNLFDWNPIIDQVPDLLKTQTKDLEFVAWYIEALLRRFDFQGLAYGFELTRRLLENFNDQLFPKDEDGLETMFGPLVGLNGIDSDGALIMPIGAVPLFIGQSKVFAAWQYEQAVELEKLTDETKKLQRIQNGAVTFDMITETVKECNPDQLRDTYRHLKQAILAFDELVDQIDALAQGGHVPTSNIKNRLKLCKEAMENIAKDILHEPVTQSVIDEEEGEETIEGETNESTDNMNGKLNRKRALEQLAVIAQFFRDTEPHSPISYSLEQAVRWSDMKLPELLDELIPDESARAQYHKFTGISRSENN
ncbi:type VI secretion system protein TssA [Aliikangiella maris]|uniref:Type VI secretion system protein TssA n=2 Tax=Aliikangiella maris TaxID=3162458 RepID=A0ABV3MNE3_9GAMM